MNNSKTFELFVDKINKNSNQRVLQYQKILSSISKQLPKEDELELYKNNKQVNNEKERKLNRTPSCSKRNNDVSHKAKSVKKSNNNNHNCSKDSIKNNSVSKLTTMKNSKNSSVLASAKKLKQCKSYVMTSKTSNKNDMNKLNLKSNSKSKTNTENNRYNKNRVNYSLEENKRKSKNELTQSKNKEINIKINNTNVLQNQQDNLNIKENEHKVVELTTGEEITYWIPQFVVYTDCSKTDYPQGFNYGNQKYNRFLVIFKNIKADNYFEALDIANNNLYLTHQNIVDW